MEPSMVPDKPPEKMSDEELERVWSRIIGFWGPARVNRLIRKEENPSSPMDELVIKVAAEMSTRNLFMAQSS